MGDVSGERSREDGVPWAAFDGLVPIPVPRGSGVDQGVGGRAILNGPPGKPFAANAGLRSASSVGTRLFGSSTACVFNNGVVRTFASASFSRIALRSAFKAAAVLAATEGVTSGLKRPFPDFPFVLGPFPSKCTLLVPLEVGGREDARETDESRALRSSLDTRSLSSLICCSCISSARSMLRYVRLMVSSEGGLMDSDKSIRFTQITAMKMDVYVLHTRSTFTMLLHLLFASL